MTDILKVIDLKTNFITHYGTVKAVNGVSFSVHRGETFGIVGESGCGKSVTAHSILRLVPKQSGRIVGGQIIFDGEDLLKKDEKQMRELRGKKISMILQDPMTSLNPVFTVGNQLSEAIRIHSDLKRSVIAEKAISLLNMVHMPSPKMRIDNWPHQLSGGMRQRVVGAISISCEPQLLIADEPTTALDATIQVQYLRLLRELQERTKMSMIIITHDFGIVARMCQRAAVMYAGQIVEIGSVLELFDSPKHPYTKALMRSRPRLNEKIERLDSIKGQPPPLHLDIIGCPFAERCTEKIGIKCLSEEPPTCELADKHLCKCWKYA